MDANSRQLIDAQFDRAVEIVQGFPKTGPIQTGYEDKLNMYSLYKQATVGNVQGQRPNVWDMLGRAKWDAWAKHKDLDPYEAKWLYVEALLKVLRKYSDKTVARDLVRELEAYAGDPTNLVMSECATGVTSPGSDSSGSSEAGPSGQMASASLRQAQYAQAQALQAQQRGPGPDPLESETDESTTDEEDEELDRVPHSLVPPHAAGQLNRPQSSLSSRPYRTPMASTLLMSPPPQALVPTSQPHPGFQTQSAFAESSTSIPSSAFPPTTSLSYPEQLARSPEFPPSAQGYPSRAGYRPPSTTGTRQYPLQAGPPRPASLPLLERAVESVQAHLAAITERLETLEGVVHHSTASLTSIGRGSPYAYGHAGGRPDAPPLQWDLDDMGMWSIVLRPLARALRLFRQLAVFLASGDAHGGRTPTFVVIRRLFLDISFVLCVLAVATTGWRRTGVRRREVSVALNVLWRAIVGQQAPRHMAERGV
ncbi:ACBP-domain-containing protein [Epithele typhae]|uniref:ACBP-domain-containing protein n=1 Tax=Epithele typhae TaxID=378194 RepID=UPI0020082F43|nr:ACBP-domain-containing protein [Epithele typhae]KAH9927112.1 ACBP-domain-containing protein [Epithele typhae]